MLKIAIKYSFYIVIIMAIAHFFVVALAYKEGGESDYFQKAALSLSTFGFGDIAIAGTSSKFFISTCFIYTFSFAMLVFMIVAYLIKCLFTLILGFR